MDIQEIARFLINPLLYVFAGLIFLLISRKKIKCLLAALTISFYIIAVPYTAHLFNDTWKVSDTFQPDQTYDAVIVLAGITDYSWYLEGSDVRYKINNYYRFNSNADRILAGIGFVKSGNARMILYGEEIIESYDKRRSFNETEMVKSFALQQGLDEEEFVVYGGIERTVDEARGIKTYVEKHSIKSLLLVTSEMHMRRAAAIFNKAGVLPDLYSVNKRISKRRWQDFVPSPKGIRLTMNALYELTAFAGYFLKGDL